MGRTFSHSFAFTPPGNDKKASIRTRSEEKGGIEIIRSFCWVLLGFISIPGRFESFWKELDGVKHIWRNRRALKVEDLNIAALFGFNLYAWFCVGEIAGRDFTITGMSLRQSSTTEGNLQNNHIYCRCNLRCNIYTSHQVDSNGRRFYRCPRNRIDDDCGFFRWIDGTDPSLSQILIQIHAHDEMVKNIFKAISFQLKFLAVLIILVIAYLSIHL